jgi:hypothetical protein
VTAPRLHHVLIDLMDRCLWSATWKLNLAAACFGPPF